MPMGRLLRIFGVVPTARGGLWPHSARVGLGRLPGPIPIAPDDFRPYPPLATLLGIGAVLRIAFALLNG